MSETRIPEASQTEQRVLFGPMDAHLRAVRERYGVRISTRRGTLLLEGEDDAAVRDVARRVRRILQRMRGRGQALADNEVAELLFDGEPPKRRQGALRVAGHNGSGAARRSRTGPNGAGDGRRTAEGRRSGAGRGQPSLPQPMTPNQEHYVQAIRRRDVVFSVGPAGTGKTYLAVAEAVAALRAESVRKLILTRPAVEAGEKLGFLPGDFQAKINPYLRPLYDALGELLPYGEVQRYVDADVIEIVPLAYMRGRTLKDAFIILDEAQNTTPAQMKMFLTRMGFGSKVVVTGDVTQVDLPEDTTSGLVRSIQILEDVAGIEVIRLEARDIQRHPLVQRIVDAYDRAEPQNVLPARANGVARPDAAAGPQEAEAGSGPSEAGSGESGSVSEDSQAGAEDIRGASAPGPEQPPEGA